MTHVSSEYPVTIEDAAIIQHLSGIEDMIFYARAECFVFMDAADASLYINNNKGVSYKPANDKFLFEIIRPHDWSKLPIGSRVVDCVVLEFQRDGDPGLYSRTGCDCEAAGILQSAGWPVDAPPPIATHYDQQSARIECKDLMLQDRRDHLNSVAEVRLAAWRLKYQPAFRYATFEDRLDYAGRRFFNKRWGPKYFQQIKTELISIG